MTVRPFALAPLTFAGFYAVTPQQVELVHQFTVAASHELHDAPEGHPCARMHGHTYSIELAFTGAPLNGLPLLDPGDFTGIATWIDGTLQGTHLNDVLDVEPYPENLAAHVMSAALHVLEHRAELGRPAHVHQLTVTIHETPHTRTSLTAHLPNLATQE